MRQLQIEADELCSALLGIAEVEKACILDSCGVGHLGSHLMIAGLRPVEIFEIRDRPVDETLSFFEECVSQNLACIFSVSYDFGLGLQNIKRTAKIDSSISEPDLFLNLYDVFIIHDYNNKTTLLTGNEDRFDEIESIIKRAAFQPSAGSAKSVRSNITKADYISAVEIIKEYVRSGDTYQTNLTHQISAFLPTELTPETIFWRLRRQHPAPFAAFLKRSDSTVVSASPERFFRIEGSSISASPIKGTRPRGKKLDDDAKLRIELFDSKKDRAENTMIVDLLRNDLGRVCKFGSVMVEKLCDIEEHPTLFHLVSTIRGELKNDAVFSDIMRAVFPCGSITGAPKIRTMQIIDELERVNRGLSMGAIGCRIPASFGIGESIDTSVAIRTMVVRENQAIFNVGGGIVIDSDPEKEYEETLTKAQALIAALHQSEV